MADRNRSEGFVDVGPGRVWYESVGKGPTVLLLHGGPGASSDYLEPLMVLADGGYRVVRYDQLGSYHSDKPDDIALWQADRFVEELEIVRTSLELGQVHLVGQSWGSFLALDYALNYPQHLKSLTLYSGAASTRECVDGMNEWRTQLPVETQQVLDKFEAAGETSHPEYSAAIQSLYAKHLCRLNPWPESLQISSQRMALPVYNTMWGPNEFSCTGNLLAWDRTNRLGEITVPTLVTCGRFDEVAPTCSETMHRGIRGSQLAIFENSSHLAHFEEPERYLEVLTNFLSRSETKSREARRQS